jgi:hypothetical protein
LITDQVNIIKNQNILSRFALTVERITFPRSYSFIFFNLQALVLVLPLFTPGQGARSMSLQEKISPVH